MSVSKGLVRVAGRTYRIVKQRPGEYEIYRILDDARVGMFNPEPGLPVTAERGVDPMLVREIAAAAIKVGKITWGKGRASNPDLKALVVAEGLHGILARK